MKIVANKAKTTYYLETEDGYAIVADIDEGTQALTISTKSGHDRFKIDKSTPKTVEAIATLMLEVVRIAKEKK